MGRSKSNLPVDEIKSEYESGINLIPLGEKYGVSYTTIRNRLLKEGVQIRKSGFNKIELPVDEIKSEYESGMTLAEVAEKYAISYSTIRNRLIEAGVQIRNGWGLSKIELPFDEIISEYQSGMTLTEVAEKYGVAPNTIRNRLREAGVQTRKRGVGKSYL